MTDLGGACRARQSRTTACVHECEGLAEGRGRTPPVLSDKAKPNFPPQGVCVDREGGGEGGREGGRE